MKELLLHIGFPKCASTTLQESLLFNVDNINFLGRSRQLEKSKNYIVGNDIVSSNGSLDFDFLRLKDGINVISDEILLMPKSLWPNWGARKSSENPKIIFENFRLKIDSFKIIVILRNQQEWIYSNYAFNYAALMKSKTKFHNFDLCY